MKLTDRQIEKLLSVQACCTGAGDSTCCGKGVTEAIVGRARASQLREWCYEALGCHAGLDDPAFDGTWREHYMDKILDLSASGGDIR